MSKGSVYCIGDAWKREFYFTNDEEYVTIIVPAGAYWLAEAFKENGIPVDGENLNTDLLYKECLEIQKHKDGNYYVTKKLGYKSGQIKWGIDTETIKFDKTLENNLVLIWNENKKHRAWSKEKGKRNIPDINGYYMWISREDLPTTNEMIQMGENCVVIIDASVLRKNGALIPSNTSWETIALNCIWQIRGNENLHSLLRANFIIVNFDLEGALVFDNINYTRTLWYLPSKFEGDIRNNAFGDIPDSWGIMVANIAIEFFNSLSDKDPWETLKNSVGSALTSAKYSIDQGYSIVKNDNTYEIISGYHEIVNKSSHLKKIVVPDYAGIDRWSIVKGLIDDIPNQSFEEYIKTIVIHGYDTTLSNFPVLTIGNLTTADRHEIERYLDIKKLIFNYLTSEKPGRPLCFAVFGKPGNGKSFGISEIAKSVASDTKLARKIEKLEFNLSQYKDFKELCIAFQRIRDVIISGNTPLVFFDEFDCEELKWLQIFLMPMQDGYFVQDNIRFSLGPCIFVFAGGIAETFDEFNKISKKENFKNKKVPDFVSRLRGYIDIQGINKEPNENDNIFMLQRAIILRSLIERKVKNIISRKDVNIDDGVLSALLYIPEYKHNIRSLEAIIEMSNFTNKSKWEQSCLPSREQLELHVDSKKFMKYVLTNIMRAEVVERIAEAEYFISNPETTSIWARLPEDEKAQYRKRASLVISALSWRVMRGYKLYYDFDTGQVPCPILETIPDKLIDDFAQRFNKLIVDKDIEASEMDDKCFLPWHELNEEGKNYYRSYIKNIPEVIKKARMYIVSSSFGL